MLFTITSSIAVNPEMISPDQIPALVDAMAQAFGSGSWALGSGLFLTLAVVGLRMFSVVKRIPKEWVPWTVAAMSLMTSVAIGLQIGKGWWQIATTGLTVALIAIGGWETIAKSLKRLLIKRGWVQDPKKLELPKG